MTLSFDRQADVLTVAAAGRTRELTPDGFLLCRDVPIARCGEMLYAAGEVPLDAGPDGLIRVVRDEATLCHPDTIRSFEAKPITLAHPDDEVTPANFRQHVVGVVVNVRAGDVGLARGLIADLLIQDSQAIDAVRDGLREVSCGYDARYEQTGPGTGRQTAIIGNHVALVEHGRCGP